MTIIVPRGSRLLGFLVAVLLRMPFFLLRRLPHIGMEAVIRRVPGDAGNPWACFDSEKCIALQFGRRFNGRELVATSAVESSAVVIEDGAALLRRQGKIDKATEATLRMAAEWVRGHKRTMIYREAPTT